MPGYVFVFVLSWALAACGGNRYPKAPTVPTDDDAFSPPVEVVMAGLDSDPAEPLQLHPGDVVQLTTISADTRVYDGLVVDAQGNLHVPLAGDVQVGGMALGPAEQYIEKAMRRYEQHLRASLVITTPTGHAASVLGAVTKPGRFVVHPGMRLADLLAEAGGPAVADSPRERTVVADLDGARLVRNSKTVPVSIPLAIRGDARHNVRVRSGDQLYVPPGTQNLIMVLGEVENPTPIAYRPGIRLTEALARAGGINTEGDRKDVRIVRGSLRKPKVYAASLTKLLSGKATDVELAPGDIVYVTENWVASTGQVLNRLAPILSVGQTAAAVAITNTLVK